MLSYCSENGPCTVQSDAKTTSINPFRWVILNSLLKRLLSREGDQLELFEQ